MVRKIVKDEAFLSLPSLAVESPDEALAQDLKDTLLFYSDRCIGIAANMIGERKRAICVMVDGSPMVMFSPVIIDRKDEFTAEEGCLSLDGMRSVTRFREIEVVYLSERGKNKVRKFYGLEAQAVQHETDHLEGILV